MRRSYENIEMLHQNEQSQDVFTSTIEKNKSWENRWTRIQKFVHTALQPDEVPPVDRLQDFFLLDIFRDNPDEYMEITRMLGMNADQAVKRRDEILDSTDLDPITDKYDEWTPPKK
jgi:hypothetical protein